MELKGGGGGGFSAPADGPCIYKVFIILSVILYLPSRSKFDELSSDK